MTAHSITRTGTRDETGTSPVVTRAITAGVAAVVLSLILLDLTLQGPLVGLDHAVTSYVVGHRTAMLNGVFSAVTLFGDETTLTVLTALVCATLWVRRRRADAVLVLVAMAGSAGLTVGVKQLVTRARPPVADVVGGVPDPTYSFPSGHTLNTAVFVGAALLVTLGRMPAVTGRRAALVLAGVVTVGVGASRVYLGFHWATDVVGAWCLAVLWLTVVAGLAPRLASRS